MVLSYIFGYKLKMSYGVNWNNRLVEDLVSIIWDKLNVMWFCGSSECFSYHICYKYFPWIFDKYLPWIFSHVPNSLIEMVLIKIKKAGGWAGWAGHPYPDLHSGCDIWYMKYSFLILHQLWCVFYHTHSIPKLSKMLGVFVILKILNATRINL